MPESLKRASWLELFYDLAFVALIAQLTYLVADHHTTITDALNTFIVGYMIFLAWLGTTVNRNLQEREGLSDKVLIQTQMVGAFMMSVFMPAVFAGDLFGFFAMFAAVRAIQVFMVLRMYRLYPEHAPKTKNIVQGTSVAAVLWLAVGLVAVPYAYVLAFCALVLDILTPLTHGKGNRVRLLNISHIQERLGLFLLLVLGESMLVVAIANTVTSVEAARPIYVLSGLLVVIAMWWIYFRDLEVVGEGVRPKNLLVYLHAHGFLFGSIVLMAAGYKNVLKHALPETWDLLLIGAGVLGMTVTVSAIRFAQRGWRPRSVIFASLFAVAVLVILYLGITFNYMMTALIALTVFCIVLALLDEKNRFRRLRLRS